MHIWAHYKTVHHHRMLVRKYCFRLGLYWQGLTHDLSKFSPVEFLAGAKYYQGYRSPNDMQRKVEGYSASWLHHKGRNKHHFEYWTDYSGTGEGIVGVDMPKKYIAEMFCDRVSACQNYHRGHYTDADAWEYYERAKDSYLMHPETREQLEQLLMMLKEEGKEGS